MCALFAICPLRVAVFVKFAGMSCAWLHFVVDRQPIAYLRVFSSLSEDPSKTRRWPMSTLRVKLPRNAEPSRPAALPSDANRASSIVEFMPVVRLC